MSKTARLFDLPLRPPRVNETLSGWLYRELRGAILERRLKPGALLPPTRVFAAECKVARGTVVLVFEQLISEGYLESRVGSGTSVHRNLPDHFFGAVGEGKNRRKLQQQSPGKVAAVVRGRISKRGEGMSRSPFLVDDAARGVRAFRANRPSVIHFPADVWSRLGARRMRMASRDTLLAGDPLGYRPLREAIAAHLGSTRGVVCHADQIMIVSGTQQALDLVTRVTLDAGDAVWMEDPGYPGATSVFRAAGAKIVPVPVDEHGMRVAEGLKRAPRARLAYTTPANQFPLCVTLALERRLQLLEWSQMTGAWVFEDDYDTEFRFAGRPLAAMQGLAPEGNVIFSGSFSKMLFPALRMGYLVIPPHLIESLRAARSVLDRYGAPIEQAVLCDFIEDGHFGRHLRRMRQVYAEHLEVLMAASQAAWGDALVVQPVQAGLQTVGRLAAGSRWNDVEFARAALECGVEMTAISNWALRWKRRDTLQIGFASMDPAEIRRGVQAIAPLLLRR